MDQMTRKGIPRVLPRHPRVKPNPLRRWLHSEPPPMTIREFAKKIGTTSSYISQLTSDSPPWPKRHIARRIGIVTEGEVMPNDLAGFSRKLMLPKDE